VIWNCVEEGASDIQLTVAFPAWMFEIETELTTKTLEESNVTGAVATDVPALFVAKTRKS
jgi:hypothetical protein